MSDVMRSYLIARLISALEGSHFLIPFNCPRS